MRKLPPIKAGTKYGFLTLTGAFEKRERSHVYAECVCICGAITKKRFAELNAGKTNSCGAKECVALSQKTVITAGERFGRLTLTGEEKMQAISCNPRRYVEAVCSCGSKGYFILSSLKKGSTQSCGCLQRERAREAQLSHGQTVNRDFHPTYGTWCAIKQRCYNPNCKAFPDYGARFIKMCSEWKDNYSNFYKWSLENGWKRGLSIHRVNNDGDYSPSNCIWTTRAVQSRGKRSNVNLKAFGEEKCLTDWVRDERCHITKPSLKYRIEKGIEPEKAITLKSIRHLV